MGQVIKLADDGREQAINSLVVRLYHTKQQTIALLDSWSRHTPDAEMYAGLAPQVADERRHIRLLGEEMRRRGAKTNAPLIEQLMSRPFAIVKSQTNELLRLCALHRGIKGFDAARCGQMVGMVDPALGRLLEQISREDARHVRWADIRIDRALTQDDRRRAYLLVDQIDKLLEGIWSKPWRELTQSRQLRRAV